MKINCWVRAERICVPICSVTQELGTTIMSQDCPLVILFWSHSNWPCDSKVRHSRHTPWRQDDAVLQTSPSFCVPVLSFLAAMVSALLPGAETQLSPSQSRPALKGGPPSLSVFCCFRLVLILRRLSYEN